MTRLVACLMTLSDPQDKGIGIQVSMHELVRLVLHVGRQEEIAAVELVTAS